MLLYKKMLAAKIMPSLIILLVALLIIITGIAIFLFRYFTQKKYDDFILKNSISLNQLKAINSRYSFYPYISFDQQHTYDNENYYNIISCSDYLIYQLQFINNDILNQIEKVKVNNQQYAKYSNEISSLIQFGQFQVAIGKLKLNKLIIREKQFIEKQTLQAYTQFSLKVTLYCSKINGYIYISKSNDFSANDILMFVRRLNDRSGHFYNDRQIWDAICRVERGRVSNKMRFSIYERDGYKCRHCGINGRFNKNVQLEIDHIIPISKGGKTTYDNLQTLCHKCNKEKGNKF